jgi:hypothetical protein
MANTIYHASTTALNAPGRFPAGALVIDARYRRQPPPWTRDAVEALFPGLYLFAPGLGSLECGSMDWAHVGLVPDYLRGRASVAAAIQPGQDAVLLCNCPSQAGLGHRNLVTPHLAQDLGLTYGGALP